MVRRFSPLLLFCQFLADLALTLCAVKIAEQLRLHIVTGHEIREQFVTVQPWVYILVLVGWSIFFSLFGVFEGHRKSSLLSDLSALWLSIGVSMMALASLFYFISPQPQDTPSRLFYAYFLATDVILLTVAHVATYQTLAMMRRRGRHLRRLLLIGGGVRGRHVAIRLRGQETAGLVLVGYLHSKDEAPVPGLEPLGDLNDTLRVVDVHQIDEVVMALPAGLHTDALRLTAQLQEKDIQVRISPDVFEMVAMKARVENFFGLPLISIAEPSISPMQSLVKRFFDVLASGILIVLLSPVMLCVAILIRLDSSGPILIHQRRVGAAGVPFFMHKFRSMRWNPDDLDRAGQKSPHDARITRVGRLIRRASLDEIPQFWNVLKGEMSLVGPRPELPAIVENYEPWQLKRFLVPPGMTGWWQINGRAERSMHQNTEIDLYYVQNYSILLDLQILARTLGAVIKGRGAF
jgi:exopolysaccharide biosynthesis polyprenyl glycosylphosphotransferase